MDEWITSLDDETCLEVAKYIREMGEQSGLKNVDEDFVNELDKLDEG